MTLAAGTRLGPYEIQAALGAGGMGEVYKARDSRLDRTVAIKILPEALAGDPQFRERFDREAHAIAALNHPHICTLHDVGREQDTDFLVMEYLEGETLADRIATHAGSAGARRAEPGLRTGEGARGGPADRGVKAPALQVDEALQVATQVADALAAAHRAGIVHRDLKPGNIFLVRRGGASRLRQGFGEARHGAEGATAAGPPLAKLLDFGLAKAAAPLVADADLS
ncbi:MAG: serine/threonine-protein kinase, partial [Tepidiformaceae bacterium]